MRSRTALLPLFVLLLLPATLSARTWTSGSYRVEADLAEVRGDRAVLKKPDGAFVEVEISKLSSEDQDYLKKKKERLAEAQSIVSEIRTLLAANNFEKASEQLELAKRAATDDPSLLSQVGRVEKAIHDCSRFWEAYRNGLASLKKGTPLKRLDYNHEVLLVSETDLVVRGKRGKYRFDVKSADSMPSWLTILIAQQNPTGDLSDAIASYGQLNASSSSENFKRWTRSRIKPERFADLLTKIPTKTTEAPAVSDPANNVQAVQISPTPPIEKLRETVGQVRELYKDQYENAKTALPEKISLIKTLLDESDKLRKEDPTAYFVMRFEAATHTAELGDIAQALEAIGPLGSQFEAEGMLPHKANLISRAVEAVKRTRSDPQARSAIDAAVALKDEALEFEQFETAKGLVDSAKSMARMLREKALIAQVNALKSSVERRESLHRDAEAARKKLAESPEDADANFKLGLYHSFVRSNWKEGLPQLAKGNIPTVAAVAKLDLANPEKADAKKKVGDKWWELAESPKYKDFKDAMQDRAAVWYRGAVGELSSLAKTSVEKRLKELENRASPASAGDNNVFLTQLRPLAVLGLEIESGEPPIHRTVTINGRKFANSVWGQPEDYEGRAKISYALGKRFDTLRGGVGFDPGYYSSLPNSSPVVFRIEGDGKVLWITPAPLGPKASATFKIDVSRVNVITFTTACFGSNYYARAAWATPV